MNEKSLVVYKAIREEFEISEMSVAAFSRHIGVTPTSTERWIDAERPPKRLPRAPTLAKLYYRFEREEFLPSTKEGKEILGKLQSGDMQYLQIQYPRYFYEGHVPSQDKGNMISKDESEQVLRKKLRRQERCLRLKHEEELRTARFEVDPEDLINRLGGNRVELDATIRLMYRFAEDDRFSRVQYQDIKHQFGALHNQLVKVSRAMADKFDPDYSEVVNITAHIEEEEKNA